MQALGAVRPGVARPTGRSSTRTSRFHSLVLTAISRRFRRGVREYWWLQGMIRDVKAHYDCVKAFAETNSTEDLTKIDVPS